MAVAALALTAMLVIAVGGASGFAWQRYDLKTSFQDVQGLKSGAIVRVAGVEVGKVTSVELIGAGVEVALSIKKENQSRVTTDSRASIGSMSLLGEPLIDISPSIGRHAAQGRRHASSRPSRRSQLHDVAETANEGIVEATALLKDIRDGQGDGRQALHRRRALPELNAFVESANEVTASINQRQGHPRQADQRSQGLRRAEGRRSPTCSEMTRRINAGEGSLGAAAEGRQAGEVADRDRRATSSRSAAA